MSSEIGGPGDLNRLAQTARKTLEKAEVRTGTLWGRVATWFAGLLSSQIPQWAKEHLVATRELKRAVDLAESRGEEIPENTIKLLEDCSQKTRTLASQVNYSQYLELVLAREPDLSPEGLLHGLPSIMPHEHEWQLNLGLLMNVFNQTHDPVLKKKLCFLAVQYLAKAAPMDEPGSKNNLAPHLGFFVGQTYHREFSIFEKFLAPALNKAFIPEIEERLFLLDTKDCQDLFSISYTVITTPTESESTEEAWADKIADAISDYIVKGDFSSFHKPPLLFDFTKEIGDLSLRSAEESRKAQFERKISELEGKVERAIEQAVAKIRREHPNLELSDEEIKSIVCANTTCLSRHEVAHVATALILPILDKSQYFKAIENRKEIMGSTVDEVERGHLSLFELFLNQTGTRLSAVHARSAVFEHLDLEELIKRDAFYTARSLGIVEYAPTGKNILYFPHKADMTRTNLFQKLEARLEHDYTLMLDHPEIAIQGRAALNLVKGLLDEISEEKWKELNDNPDTRMLIQSTLYRLMQHLAKAENQMQLVDTSLEARIAFTKSIDLAQAEISTLLSVFSPFTEENFQEIYRSQLTHIPRGLQEFIQAGVGKSAMNIFAGANMLASQTAKNKIPERVISEGTYFEEVAVIGESRTPKNIIDNPAIKRIHLYVGEFNHNVNIDPKVSHYEQADIIGEVEALLHAKPETERLTVAIDETIDFVRSKNVSALLTHFSHEIQSGKLNVVFFRSGQKFDMLGQDHYYGSPFYLLNNGDEHWKAFNRLLTDPLFKTDPLSMQWFCLANKYGFEDMEDYREAIFLNARKILDNIPDTLKAGNNPQVRVSTASKNMEAPFIDVKYIGDNNIFSASALKYRLFNKFKQYGQAIHERSSFGFPHTNCTVIMDAAGKPRTLRINPGLDLLDVKLITEFLNEVASDVVAE